MRKAYLYLLLCGAAQLGFAQDAIHNFGNMQIHGDAMVGFHTDLVNDGSFDQNEGLAGFYGEDESLRISGAFSPVFFDTEIAVDNSLILETSIGVSNNVNLITGDIVTPKSQSDIYANFFDFSFYTGESGRSKVNGYAAMINRDQFVFPVGDDTRLRPLTIESLAINPLVKCAYFFEDPGFPDSLEESYSTNVTGTAYISVSTVEFWKLEGDVPSRVTLSWDEYSDVQRLGDYVSDLKVVGWSKAENQWVNLGNTAVEGGMAYGSVTSEEIVPNDYAILTIGGNADDLETFETIELDNYFMTPNGDGQNDILELDGIDRSPNNTIQIFNRYGVLVYSKDNYRNDFNGVSNRNGAIQRGAGLDSGIYFYVLTMHDLRQKHQGYLYISN